MRYGEGQSTEQRLQSTALGISVNRHLRHLGQACESLNASLQLPLQLREPIRAKIGPDRRKSQRESQVNLSWQDTPFFGNTFILHSSDLRKEH